MILPKPTEAFERTRPRGEPPPYRLICKPRMVARHIFCAQAPTTASRAHPRRGTMHQERGFLLKLGLEKWHVFDRPHVRTSLVSGNSHINRCSSECAQCGRAEPSPG